MEDFKPLGRAGEGAHGFVFKAIDRRTQKVVALKKICFNPHLPIPKNTMREICALRALKSKHIVELLDLKGATSSVVLVMEYLPCSLSDVLRNAEPSINLPQTKTYMKMFLAGVDYMHGNHVMHRDLKPANLLISELGVLKIADFGLARIYKKSSIRTYTHQVATRWYRAPELLYGSRTYTPAIDIWAVGCIFAEMVNKQPLFPGETDIEQLAIVLGTLGTPNEEVWPGLSSLPDYNKISFSHTYPKQWELIIPNADKSTLNLIKMMLQYNEERRPNASQALNHEFFFIMPSPSSLDKMPNINDIKAKMSQKVESFDTVLEGFTENDYVSNFNER